MCVCVRGWVRACVCVCVRACVRAWMRACVRACVCTFHPGHFTGWDNEGVNGLCLINSNKDDNSNAFLKQQHINLCFFFSFLDNISWCHIGGPVRHLRKHIIKWLRQFAVDLNLGTSTPTPTPPLQFARPSFSLGTSHSLAQRSDVLPDQTDGHLVVVNSREVEIKVHVVGTEVRYSPRSD